MEISGYAQQRETLDGAFKAEEEARRRIEAAGRYAKVVQQQAQDQIQHIKDEYTKQIRSEDEHAEQEIATHRLKNYDRLRTTKQTAKQEIEDTRRTGERELKDMTHSLETRKTEVEKTKEREIGNLQRQAAQQISSEDNTYKSQLDALKSGHQAQMEATRATQGSDLQTLQSTTSEAIEAKREALHEAKQKVDTRYDNEHQALLQDRNARILKVYQETENALSGMRSQFSEKLDLLRSRYQDEFYRLKHLDMEFSENPDQYIVSLPMRADEQNQVSIALKGQTLVVTMKRQFDDREKSEPGRQSSTSQYQSVQEAIDLPIPVDPRSLSKSYENGEVVVRVEKKTGRAANLTQELQLINKRKEIEQRLAREDAQHSRAPKFPKAVEAATQSGARTLAK